MMLFAQTSLDSTKRTRERNGTSEVISVTNNNRNCDQKSPPNQESYNQTQATTPPYHTGNQANDRISYSIETCGLPWTSHPEQVAPLFSSPSSVNSEPCIKSAGDTVDYTVPLPLQTMFATESVVADSYPDATKSLLQSGGSHLANQYYNSAVYSGQSLPFVQGYPSQAQAHNYYAASRALKQASSFAAPHPLTPYFSGSAAPAYYGSYASQPIGGQTLDYTSAYAAAYPAGHPSYYGSAYGSYGGTPAATTTTTYQISQLPPCTSLAASTNPQTPTSLTDISSFAKTETKKSKSKKKKPSVQTPPPESDYERVFIWDMEETCLQHQALTDGSFAVKFQKDASQALTTALHMEDLIMQFADSALFLRDLQECDQVHLDDVATDEIGQDLTYCSGYNFGADGFQLNSASPLCLAASGAMRGGVDWMRKLAMRYRRIRDLYDTCRERGLSTVLANYIGVEKAHDWAQLRSQIETITDSWHSLSLKCLAAIADRPRYTNVIVTSNPLVPTLSKLLLYELAPAIRVENVFSASKVGREACIERILSRFGKKTTYVIVGPGREEAALAKQMQLPFWPVTSHSDLTALHAALSMGHL